MNLARRLTALSAAAAVVGFGAPAFAAGDTATTNGSATAEVVIPISVTNTADLDFGAITPNGSAAVVSMSAAGSRTGSADVLIGGGSPNAAAFTVAGDADRAFTFTLPAGEATLASGLDEMTVDTWTSDAPATVTGGSVSVNVGGALHVAAAQPAGDYTGTFAVTATYN